MSIVDCGAKIITIIDKVIIKVGWCGGVEVWRCGGVVCGPASWTVDICHLVLTGLVSGAWLSGSLLLDCRQTTERKRPSSYKDNHYSQQTIY